ncbi:uncharacterized protein MONOS_88 [Monocercomonoides exilis]|uniref:uncharacterized protein n=1 Tax=Monocercomonoides exilis TaxID=2049356 RepID=UPI00355A9B3D|nr:hypothetical protein MONOS_88 [Monocercomonoides exilis]|eukprot:MONOS_88.1-p1 / transcript=MONOS_88.1 / gene=MONOS_88 / organism=Monocercomonoides_exilis_PA203 / gene_product=unspecified product / transcript_product=unspecified product / location=Mono_scaffold00002:34951-35411(-) / protein_length=107 / sequence_SO=supercontig / SO=protein_coding / is_pseudo=false
MRERKILKITEEHITEVKELKEDKEAKGQFVATKEKAGLIGVRIEKEKKSCSLQSEVEKIASVIKDGSAVMLGPDLNGKWVVVKVGSEVSVVGEANGGGGGGGGSE